MVYRKVYRKKKRNPFLTLLRTGGILFLLAVLSIAAFVVSCLKDLPQPEKFTEKEIVQSTKIYARDGQTVLYEIYDEERRTVISLNEMPTYLKQAVIAAEDADFYKHKGIDLKGVARAVMADLKILAPAQGASTISQQLIRSSYLTPEKTTVRKTKEIILTLELEMRYSKDQILEFYLNQIPFGQNAYGVEKASETYFQKKAADLSLGQAAMLAAIIKSPSRLSPYGSHLDELLQRKDYVLQRMLNLGFITAGEKNEAEKEILKFAKTGQTIKAPHFVLWVKDLLEQEYGEGFLKQKGVNVYTTLDWDLQQKVEKIVQEQAAVNRVYYDLNAAVVVLDPKTGEILAMVGSKDFFGDPYPKDCHPGKDCLFDPQYNAALALRQPGSAFKPFVYATAFKKGFDDKTIVYDELTSFGIWGDKEYIPYNYDGLFRGPVTLRQALAQSLNVPSVKVLLNLAGLEDSVQTAQDLGITSLKPPFGPSMVLGGYEVSLLEMTSAYSGFANQGLWVKSSPILSIKDDRGNNIWEFKPQPRRVLDSKVADLINDILSDNEARAPIFGTHSLLYFDSPGVRVCAKTGTTQDYRDGWAIGYAPFVAVGVWTGNNNNEPMSKEPGIVMAGPIFHRIMTELLPKQSLSP